MLNFAFLEKNLGIVSPPHFLYNFSRKMFLMLCSINWPNIIIWLSLLLEPQKQPPEVFCVKRCSWRNFKKLTGKHLCQGLFFNKVAGTACNFIKKETLAQKFSCEFWETSKNTFFIEHLWTTASVLTNTNQYLTNPNLANLYLTNPRRIQNGLIRTQ